MNILDDFTIPVKGLSAGSHDFTFEVDRRFFDAAGGSLITGGEARVEVKAAKTAGGLALDFHITGRAEVECDRCLEPLTLPVDYSGVLTVRAAEGREEDYDGEVMWIGGNQTEVNVAQYIYESICLSLPMTRVHGQDENGVSLCDPDMLARFSIVSAEQFDGMAAEKEKNDGQSLKAKLEKIKDNL